MMVMVMMMCGGDGVVEPYEMKRESAQEDLHVLDFDD